MVIDVGWTEVSIPEYNAKKDTGACVHIIATENAKLGKKAVSCDQVIYWQ
jgi:hypothetical protein